MSKLGFFASFVAAFVTMDAQFFGGATTKVIWGDILTISHAADTQIARLAWPILHR